MFRKILYSLLLITLVLYGAYNFRAPLAFHCINAVLEDTPISLTQLDNIEFNLNTIYISQLEFEQRDSSAKQQLSGLTIQFQIEQLLAGKIEAITAEQATIDWQQNKAQDKQIDFSIEDNLAFIKNLPVAHIEINRLTIKNYFNNTIKELATTIDKQPSAIEVILKQEEKTVKAQLNWLNDKQLLINIQLLNQQTLVTQLNIQAEPKEQNWLTLVEGDIVLADLVMLFNEYDLDLSKIEPLSGKIDFSSQLSIANNTTNAEFISLHADATLSAKITDSGAVIDSSLKNIDCTQLPSLESNIALELQCQLQVSTTIYSKDIIDNIDQLQINTGLKTSKLSLEMTNNYPRLNFNLQTNNLYIGLGTQWLPDFDINTDISIDNNSIKGQGRLSNNKRPDLILFELNYDYNNHRADLDLTIDQMRFDNSEYYLADSFLSWPYNFNLLNGEFSLSSSIKIDMQPSIASNGTLEFTANNLNGYIGDIIFQGASTHFSGDIVNNQLISQTATDSRISKLDIGFPITDIELIHTLNTGTQLYSIDRFSADFLGGNISVKDFAYQPLEPENPFSLIIKQLQLEQVLALAEYDTVSATGIIDAQLPITIHNHKLSITAGTLEAVAPGGVIQYKGDERGITDPSLKFVHKALSNYHFDTLDSIVNYRENGDLVLEMQLSGINPDLNNNQKINLNLNISDNIPNLLKSLQAGRDISEILEQKIQ